MGVLFFRKFYIANCEATAASLLRAMFRHFQGGMRFAAAVCIECLQTIAKLYSFY